MQAYQHPDGEWGEVHGFANGYKDANKVAELIDAASVESDTGRRAALYKELNEILYNDPMAHWCPRRSWYGSPVG